MDVDDDADSLFGSSPPPDEGLVSRNVASIALPGSHMSCSGLPPHFTPHLISASSETFTPGTNGTETNGSDDETDVRSQDHSHSQHQVTKKGKPRTKSTSSRPHCTNVSGNTSHEEILRQAQERRRQLIAEIECAKVELWETSIEGGVLVHLMKGRIKRTT
ncbi:hypothetical protein ID866_5763 [Astraeus odoratus]|nr:hypothetical protein ID866_5763 [Astraeus odoratus]